MNNSSDDLETASYLGNSHAYKQFSIPLMNKKQNSIEKYVSSYKLGSNLQKKASFHRRADSLLSSNGSRLVYGGKFTPDDRIVSIDDDKSYVKYSPIKNERTQERIEILERVQNQYIRLKNNFDKDKNPFISKFSIPLREALKKQKSLEKQRSTLNLSSDEISKQMKKQRTDESGRKIYPDLELIKKGRTKLLRQIENGKKSIQLDEGEQYSQQEQKQLLQKKIKQIQQKKKKMLQKKGLHWNVYYEMMALTNDQKNKVKNARFVEIYGGK